MLSTLALAAFAGCTTPIPGGEPPLSQSFLKAYEVDSCAPVSQTFSASQNFYPLLRGHSITVECGRDEVDPGVVVDLVSNLNPAEWQYEGREIAIEPDGRMLVRAPAALQDSTARFLGFLEGSIGRPTELVVDIVTLANGADEPALSAVVPVSELTRLVNAAKQGGTHRSFSLSIAAGSTAHVQAVRTLQMVTDYDVEIAQAAATFDPIVESVPVGTRIQAQVSPAQAGLWLALIVSDGAPLSEIEAREHRMQGSATTDQGVSAIAGPRRSQDVLVAERTFALNTFLPDGKALVMRSTIEGALGHATEFVFVRQEGGPTPAFYKLPDDMKKSFARPNLLLIRGDSTTPPRVDLGGRLSTLDDTDAGWTWLRAETDAYLTANIVRGASDPLASVLQDPGGTNEVTFSGAWVVVRESALPPPESGSQTAPPEDPLVTLKRLTPDPYLHQLTMTLKRGAAGDAAARCTIPIRSGALSAVLFGKEHLMLGDFDVEVAQSASVSDPVVFNTFEGLHVQVRPRTNNSGGLVLALQVHGRLRRGAAREFDPGSTALSTLDQEDADRLDLSQTVTFARAEGGPRRVVLGNTGSSTDALTLDLEVTDLR